VRYALAVRYARREEYAAAARLYEGLQSKRASTMREAERLFSASRAADVSPERHLNAVLEYASFLASHEDGIFFNDMLWDGFQTAAFVYRNPDTREPDRPGGDHPPSPDEERKQFERKERRLRDDQEEYWRAYKILSGVVDQAGPTPLGKRAAALAVSCLRRINVNRFGRADEINDADTKLSTWLIRNKNG
jgi:hypothetical protein